MTREEILAGLRSKVNRGEMIIGGGAGTGLSAKCEEAGGIDLMVIYNSGRFRMAGRGSIAGYMAYGNANEIVMEMASEVLPVVERTPVLAGVNATDPFCLMDSFLKEIKNVGFAGVQNFPTVGLIDGRFRRELEATGMSYQLEVDMIAKARKLDLLTTPYVFNANEAAAMAAVGADIIVTHFGLTNGGTIGAVDTAPTIEQCAVLFQEWSEAALQENENAILIAHGGPLAEPGDVAEFMQLCPQCHGFYGASSMERLPTERAIRDQVLAFKNIKHPKYRGAAE